MRANEDAVLGRFQGLGDEIEARWCAEDYAEAVFPSLAADALRRADLPSTLGLGDLLRWALETSRLPAQRDLPSRFGDPALTLFVGPRFFVEVYVWFAGTTALHQHGFAGAFQVLQGSSIHGHSAFRTSREVNPYFRLGRLELLGCDLLEAGAVQEIRPGSDYIHRLYHLDHPSATLVVRTTSSPGNQPQFSYLPPSVAIDPFYEEPTATKRLQCLRALYRARDAGADEAAAAWVARADLHTAFQVLSAARLLLGRDGVEQVFGVGGGDDRFRRLLDAARARHGDAVDRFEEVFAEQERLDRLVALRSAVTDPELRFFLALLLNVDERDAILALVGRRFPEDRPLEKVLEWVRALGRTRIFGSAMANALGVEGFDDFDLLVLEQLLADASERELVDALGASPRLDARLATLRDAPVLRPLLRAASARTASP